MIKTLFHLNNQVRILVFLSRVLYFPIHFIEIKFTTSTNFIQDLGNFVMGFAMDLGSHLMLEYQLLTDLVYANWLICTTGKNKG